MSLMFSASRVRDGSPAKRHKAGKRHLYTYIYITDSKSRSLQVAHQEIECKTAFMKFRK